MAPQLSLPAYVSIAVMLFVIWFTARQEMKLIRGQLAAFSSAFGAAMGYMYTIL